MLSAILFFNEGFANIVTITFTALIAIELLNVFTVVSFFPSLTILSGKQTKLENDRIISSNIYSLHLIHRTTEILF